MEKNELMTAIFVLGILSGECMNLIKTNPLELCPQEHLQYGTLCPSMMEGENEEPFVKFAEWVPHFSYNNISSYGMEVKNWWERSVRVVSVDEFGAKGDGETDDSKAFKKTWKEVCSSAYTVFLVPHGKKYLVKPVRFSGPCKSALTLQVSGTIIAPGDPKVWEGLNRRQWLRFKGINDLTVTGGGTFYGSGDQWWAQSCKINKTNPCQSAPTAVIFESSNNLRVKNIIVENSQQMHVKFRKCVGVHADHLKVLAPAHSPNTDGLHISASRHVVITNSIIGTGDDCISIVGDSFNIKIKNIICGPGHGISIGSLGKGNSEAQVSEVKVHGASLYNTKNGLRIKTWQGGSGSAKGIKFQKVHMENVKHPIIINQFYCDSTKPCPTKASAVKVSDITFKNIKGTSATKEVMRFACSDMVPCENIVLQDIDLTLSSGSTPTTFCENAIGYTIGSVSPQSCLQRCQQCKEEHAITHNFSYLPKDEL
ncbi:hypothetical protein SUGI_0979380 [Cryptomeria japonica]|uniref:probable polygalacturonase At1g80170 n=1 Tax=Cryptomeria japonica TaxID=3369 RepID=UPI002414CA99|nr:probable polygalacturonase At1g80170 [Cryptomeria japonica]GLJ46470.1 hypothetical protein SUGI_0979380 [Cryptomeria japonica]